MSVNSHTAAIDDSEFACEFKRLDALLQSSRSLWQNRAFDCKQLPWQAQFPRLAQAVWALDDRALDGIDVDQLLLASTLVPALEQDIKAQALSDDPAWDLSLFFKSPAIEAFGQSNTQTQAFEALAQSPFSAHIKGRKWAQITAFVEQIPTEKTQVLEWCAGKGHLGRLIAKMQQRQVVSLEWQQSLCDAGEVFAKQWQLPQQFVCTDAYAEQSALFEPKQLAVALHACGDLHVRLLQNAAKAGTESIVIAPCCYHLIQADNYQALSSVAKNSDLQLSRANLQLPLQQSTIANPAQVKLRHQEMQWRLGFDALQRDLRQLDVYLPIPAIRQSQLKGSFADFCHWAASCKGLSLKSQTAFSRYEDIGLERHRLTRRIDLVAHLFRSILERWLLLDRVCFLQEQGYRVELKQFCAANITPRNALIRASK